MSEETQPQSQIPNHSDVKARLECEKLRAEIKAIDKPLYKTPSFYSAFAPVVLAVLGLLFSWSTGWFDVQRTRVNNEKTLVEAQTERLKIERATLEAQAREQQVKVSWAEGEINKLKQRESNLTNEVARLSRERDELVSAKESLESEAKRLAGSDAKASQFLEQLKSLQETRERLSSDLESLQVSNVRLRMTNAHQVTLIRWADEVLSEGWSIALKDKVTWAKFKEFGGNVLNVRSASMSYLQEWQVDPNIKTHLDGRGVRSYEVDYLSEINKMFRRETRKSADDYLSEAHERLDLLNSVKFDEHNDSTSDNSFSPAQNPQSH